jgi:hypothetical protein
VLVIHHKDRLLRFGSELIFKLCHFHEIKIVMIEDMADKSFEENLSADVIELIEQYFVLSCMVGEAIKTKTGQRFDCFLNLFYTSFKFHMKSNLWKSKRSKSRRKKKNI